MSHSHYVKLEDALAEGGHPSVRALTSWIIRWNLKHPNLLILRRYNQVDTVSLKAALEQCTRDRTPGYNLAAAVAEAKQKKTPRLLK